ncbi:MULTISPECIES: flagellar basal body-associated FliL family protein [unclassified Paenibacillus]|uniref:flagellar basal body-associated FliL family protein n=1 Tax=unclassified Paenibacillus TaxID=185978 RepID=UPI0002D33637|nr:MULTISPECIES: flagellar basal body-associated FliL family protein [unclassified Paenibacillus]MCM3337311.1 flagellar basal body-associated FliL family protein [Paenibacillus sp. MER TA 81-3]
MKRMLPWMITLLLALTLIALVVIMLTNSGGKPQAGQAQQGNVHIARLSADEIVEMTSIMSDIKTNLADRDYVALTGFAFQLDNKKTKEQFDKIKDLRIKPLILRTLADMKPEELQGMKGQDQLCAKLLDLINKQLPEGKVIQVDLTDFIMTRI